MALSAGTRLGRYEVAAPIGAGGMGEVYRAHDTQLRRDVAIKVVAEAIGADPDRLRRFEQEALATAALNHPNIVAVYDVGVHEGRPFVVSELLDGRTLREILVSGALPARKAVEYAAQIASGLAAAHDKGIVHRDLKPENLMVTRDDRVKILDFGIARILRNSPIGGPLSDADGPTRTVEGVVLGTVGYMAPEQVRGEAVDHRADIFALGAVFYEMLTRRRAFQRDSVPGTLAAILDADPPTWPGDGSALSSRALRLIHRCLDKSPAARFQSARDLALVLADERTDTSPTTVVPNGRRRSWPAVLAGAAAVAVIVTAYLFGRAGPSVAAPPRYVYDIPLPQDLKWWAGMALSPDGRHMAIVTQPPPNKEGTPDPRLWMRDLSSDAEWQLVSGGAGVIPRYPFWSPDGRSLAYFRQPVAGEAGKLIRVDLSTLTPTEICDAQDPRGGAWLSDGTIVFAPGPETGLYRVNGQGGTPALLVDRAGTEVGLKFPAPAGPGRLIFLAQDTNQEKSELRLLKLDDPAHPVTIVKTPVSASFDVGTLFYRRSGVWVGQSFDPSSGRLSGDGVPVPVDAPASAANVGATEVSASGGHVAIRNSRREQLQAVWVSRNGTQLRTLAEPAAQYSPSIAPDGKHVAISRFDPGASQGSLWIIDAESGAGRRLISAAESAVWHPDGVRLAVLRMMGIGGNGNAYQIRIDDNRSLKALLEAPFRADPAGWIGATDRMVINTFSNAGGETVPHGIVILEPDGKTTLFRAGNDESTPALSADGSRIAYITTASGEKELLVDRFPTPGARPVRVSHGAVDKPRWRADGRELFFIDQGRLMAASVSEAPTLTVGVPTKLFDVPSTQYAVDPTRDRFLILIPTSAASSSVRVTLNWRGAK